MGIPTLGEIGAQLKEFGDKAVSGMEALTKRLDAVGADVTDRLTKADKRIDDLSTQMRERPNGATAKTLEVMADIDWKRFNFAKAVLANLTPDDPKRWEKAKAEYERDAIGAVNKTMTVAAETTGGFLVPAEQMAGYIEPYRSKVPSFEIPGIKRLTGLTGSPVKIPRQTSDVTSYWLSETGAPTRNDPAFDQILLTPKKCGAETRVSRDLILQSPTAADQVIRSSIFESLLRLRDTAFWQGTGGSGQPIGLDIFSGVNSVTFSGSTDITKFTVLQQMVEEIEVDNGSTESLVWVMSPRVWHSLAQIQLPQAASSVGFPVLSNGNYAQKQPRTLLGYPVYLTTNITASTTSIVKLFDPTQMVVGEWGTVEIFTEDRGATLRSSDLVQVNGWARVDHHVMHPESICLGPAYTY